MINKSLKISINSKWKFIEILKKKKKEPLVFPICNWRFCEFVKPDAFG